MSSDIIVNQQHNQPRRPNRLVFHSVFQFWAKPRLPPDVASVAPLAGDPSDLGSGAIDAVVVPNRAVAAGDAAHVAGGEPGDGFLRSCLTTGIWGQRSVSQGLVRSLLIIVNDAAYVRLCPYSELHGPSGIAA